MAFRYRNASPYRRRWDLPGPDGSTLELGPGETADLAHEVDAPHLERVRKSHAKSEAEAPDARRPEPEGADSAVPAVPAPASADAPKE